MHGDGALVKCFGSTVLLFKLHMKSVIALVICNFNRTK